MRIPIKQPAEWKVRGFFFVAHLVSSKFPQMQIAQVHDVQLSDEGRASQRPTFVTRQSETSTWLPCFGESTGFCLLKTRRKGRSSRHCFVLGLDICWKGRVVIPLLEEGPFFLKKGSPNNLQDRGRSKLQCYNV